MRRFSILCCLSVLLCAAFTGSARAEIRSYALVVGNNRPFNNPGLEVLKFADDDAVRYYRFFQRVTNEAYLLTVPDVRTQKRYSGIGERANPPTRGNLNRAVADLARRMASDRQQGHKTVLYFAFSGHGDHAANGEVFLSLLDGGLTGRDLYRDVLGKLKADYQHVFIDACYAEGVVGFRGAFDNERDGQFVALSEAEVSAALGEAAEDFPGLGIVVSSSMNTASHEWSRIESGVFTHEVLSALSGAADVNLDGRIEYSELAAFIAAANLDVSDARGRIDVVARPPDRNQNVAIVDLASLKRMAFLAGDPSSLGHFSIELNNGEKYLDANLSAMKQVHIAVPLDVQAYLYTRTQEAVLRVAPGNRIDLAMLDFTERRIRSRGGVADALRDGLFATGYGKSFYTGFVDSKGFICVPFDSAVFMPEGETAAPALSDAGEVKPFRKPLAASLFTLAGVAAVGAVTFGALSLSAKNTYEGADSSTGLEEMGRLNEKYQNFGTASWVMVGIAPVALAAGLLVYPWRKSKKDRPAVSGVSIGPDGGSLSVSF